MAHHQGYVCGTCGEPLANGEELHVHHRIPRAQGGMDAYDNLERQHLYGHQQIHARKAS